MAYSDLRLIPQSIQDRFIQLLSPMITVFSKWGLSPNPFTFAGIVITSLAAVTFMMGYIRLAGMLILLGGVCDTVDGLIARTNHKATRFGALLDSSVDRYSECIMFLGFGAYFILNKDYGTLAGTFLALCGSFMVSYTRARCESLGFQAKVGIVQRPERIILIGMGALIHITAFEFAIWLIAFLANITALQRIRCAYKQSLNGFKQDAVLKT